MPEVRNTDERLYGAFETNTLSATGIRHEDTDNSVTVDWNDPDLAKITRIRLLSDPGFPVWDVSYVLGTLRDGRQVHVHVPFHQLGKRTYMKDMYDAARTDGIRSLNRLCGGHLRDVLSRLS